MSHKNKIQKIVYFFLIVICGCKNQSPVPVNSYGINDTCLILRNWHIVGPFLFSKEGNNLNEDDLTIFGFNEDEISCKEFMGIDSTSIKKQPLDHKLKSITGSNDKPVLNLNLVLGPKDINNANAYMGCVIRTTKEITLRLNFSSDNGAKVWLNNQLVLNYDKELSVFAYEHYVPVRLSKGDNFLLIKVYNSSGDWLMYARLEKESNEGLNHHQRIQTLLNNRNFLKRSLLDTLTYLEANNNLPFGDYRLSMLDRHNKVVFNETVSIKKDWRRDVSILPEGLYTVRLFFNRDTLEQLFYKGDVVGKIQELLKNKKNDIPLNDKNDLDANIYRFNHLLKPQNSGSNFAEKQGWQKKMVYLYRDISSIITDNPNHTLKDEPGFHIRTYVSEIDNHPQYYVAHVPKNFKKSESYPVVFLIPFKVTYNYHYLESMRVADLQLIENMQEVADKNNIIVVEPFFREVGIPTFNGIEETDFFEVLQAIRKDYNIKMDQLYFVGSCEGAHKAFKLAVKYPDIPAALGFISPIYAESYGYSSGNQWVANNEPLNYLKNVRNIPISIIHSKLDGHVSISVSEQFANSYKTSGLSNLELRKLEDVVDQYYWTQYSNDLVKSLLKHKKVDNPRKISLSTTQLKWGKAGWLKILNFQKTGIGSLEAELKDDNVLNVVSENVSAFSIDVRKLAYKKDKELTIIENNKTLYTGKPSGGVLTFNKEPNVNKHSKTAQIEGPFCDVFLHKFIIVAGTKGTPKENAKLKALGDSLVIMWKYKYWNDCEMKYDTDITPNDIANSNLILLGNVTSNQIIGKISNRLPLSVSQNSISISTVKTSGTNLGFYIIYPNPINRNRYVAIIGYNNPNFISLGPVDLNENDYKDLYTSGWVRSKLEHMEISCYGWFDYRIWDNSDFSKPIIGYGYFDSEWK